MKTTVCLYTYNNGVGLVADTSLIQNLLYDDYALDVQFLDKNITLPSSDKGSPFVEYDIGIYFQEFDINTLNRNKKNILIANEEWTREDSLRQLHNFDKIITKSTLATELLKPYNRNVCNCGFISKDKYDPNIEKQKTCLHVAGKSSQKGTELILDCFIHGLEEYNITILESKKKYEHVYKTPNINYIGDFLSEEDINYHYNRNLLHLCTSYYEGWGHYLYEGLSTGALVFLPKLPMFLEWIDPDLVVFLDCEFEKHDENIEYFKSTYYGHNIPYQFGWKVSRDTLCNSVSHFNRYLENHNESKVRQFFKDLTVKNSKKLLVELTNL